MTRYEFAVAVARMIPVIEQRIMEQVKEIGVGGKGERGPVGPAGAVGPVGPAGPAGTAGVTPEQFTQLQCLVNEFRDELATLGVDVDALKREVAGLAARVQLLEDRYNRFRIDGILNTFVTATSVDEGIPFDLDNRPLQLPGAANGELINSVSVINDMDLWVRGNLTPALTVAADINFGNYLPAYLQGLVSDYNRVERTVAARSAAGPEFTNPYSFVPYYMYGEWGFSKGSLAIGRIPLQFTPYTLKMIDVDSYTFNEKTDLGDYPLDGGKVTFRYSNFGLTGFAVKTDQNSLVGTFDPVSGARVPGLVAQPTIALYAPEPDAIVVPGWEGIAPFHEAGGHSIGGLISNTQVAGARAVIGTPCKGNLGLTYIQAAGPVTDDYDTAMLWGADGRWQFGNFMVAADYTQTNTTDDEGINPDIEDDNTAIDGNVGFNWCKVGVDVGYRTIGRNFAAPGYWTKIGMWTNPTNIKGPYLRAAYGITPTINLVVDGAFYNGQQDIAVLPDVIDGTDDEVWRASGGLRWGMSNTNSLSLGWDYINWTPTGATDSTIEQYINIGWAYQFNPSAGFNLSYQIIDYDPDAAVAPYGTDPYKGAVAVAQFKAKF
jgi:hypothetical protein